MKRVITLIIIIAFFYTEYVVAINYKIEDKINNIEISKENGNLKRTNEEFKNLVDKIKTNNTKIASMKNDSIEKYKLIIQKVRHLIQNRDKLSIEQMEVIKESLEIFKSKKSKISLSNNDSKINIRLVKSLVKSKNRVEAFKILIRYNSIQISQIQNLKEINQAFEAIENIQIND